MAIKIHLDAGHYGKYNRSPAVKDYYESDMNWKLHLKLKKYLEDYGFIVTQTRINQAKDMGLYERGESAKGCDVFISIHSNAVGSNVDENTDYPLVIVPIDGSANKIGSALAEVIEDTMNTKQSANVISKKGNSGDYYGVIRGATAVGVPGIILEHSFHTNTKSTKWLMSDANLDKLAKAEADAIAKHFGVKKPTTGGNDVVIELQLLRLGSKGIQVQTLQHLLKAYGHKGKNGRQLVVDGDFGANTDYALRAFQKEEGLAVDAACGINTWTKLLKG